MSNNEMHDIIKEYKEYQRIKEEAEARISELGNIIKSEMKTQETDKMIVNEYKCSLATITSNRVDSKALQEKRPEVYNAFIKTSTYERLTVN